MADFRAILEHHPPLLLFLVIGLGYLFGQIRVRGFGFGVAGVLFAGLAFGAWQPAGAAPLTLPREVQEVGLILFVYAVGLSSGPGFFSALRQRGLRCNAAVVIALLLGAAAALAGGLLLGLSPGLIGGVFCGALTNTPALAATTELLAAADPAAAAEPTLGYSVAYPFAVAGYLLSFQILTALRRPEWTREREHAAAAASGERRVIARDFEISNPALFDRAIGELRVQDETGLIISRIRHGGDVSIPSKYTRLQRGDVVVAVGRQADMERAPAYFGRASEEHIELSRESIDMRRILVSNRRLVGKTLDEIDLDRRFNAQVTRLRRADFDMVPSPDTALELGDRLRIVMPRERVGEVTRYFGDSERSIAELDYTAITLGISLGVLLGMVPIPLPGSSAITLGIAGGPLVVALILGRLGRTGPIVWSIPYEANEAIRHVGLLFFLAGVGCRAGSQFLAAVESSGLQLLALGVLTTVVTTVISIVLMRTLAGASLIATLGATSGLQTQPASLARAREMSGSDETYVAYAITYPVAMIGKILLAQLLVLLARHVA